MLAHASHLLQPLDVGCFTVLKRSYGRLVENKMRLGINYIDKLDFLVAYLNARAEAFRSQTIQNSFLATGLVPYDPERVLLKLDIQLKTPTPPGSRPGSRSSQFTPKTPQNLVQLRRQASSIKATLERRSYTPPTPTDRMLNQVFKGCELAINSAILLADENTQLRATNEKQKQKRRRSTRQIPREGRMTVQESHEIV